MMSSKDIAKVKRKIEATKGELCFKFVDSNYQTYNGVVMVPGDIHEMSCIPVVCKQGIHYSQKLSTLKKMYSHAKEEGMHCLIVMPIGAVEYDPETDIGATNKLYILAEYPL